MRLLSLSRGVAALDPVRDPIAETHMNEVVEHGTDVGLTARAVILVTLAGAGLWYLLWKLALLFVSGR